VLAVEPAVLLLDEPLSALDLKLRQHMRAELRAIQRKTGITFIYITHDQGEALTMSDRVAVMKDGVIEQVGTGDEVYGRPATPFVASFVGETNIFRGTVAGLEGGMAVVDTPLGRMRGRSPQPLSPGDSAMVFVRPEHVALANGQQPPLANLVAAEVERRDLEGPFVNVFLNAQGREIAMHLTNTGDAGRALVGRHTVGFRCEDAIVLPSGPLARTGRDMVDHA
jgi:spermidine/putrescine transport system ATP-binding protein